MQNEFSPFAHSIEHRRKSNISWCSSLKSCTRDVQTRQRIGDKPLINWCRISLISITPIHSHLLLVFRQFRLRTYLQVQLCAVATMLHSGSFNPCHATHVFHSASLPVPDKGIKHGNGIDQKKVGITISYNRMACLKEDIFSARLTDHQITLTVRTSSIQHLSKYTISKYVCIYIHINNYVLSRLKDATIKLSHIYFGAAGRNFKIIYSDRSYASSNPHPLFFKKGLIATRPSSLGFSIIFSGSACWVDSG